MLIMLADEIGTFKVFCLEDGEEFVIIEILSNGIKYTWLNGWELCPEMIKTVQGFVETELKRLWPRQNLTSINGLDVY